MKEIIRWPGLGVFSVFFLLLFLFTFFFVDGLVEKFIEKQGSALVGARVDLGRADLSFFPAGLELSDLQITNPDAPLRNIVEIQRISFAIDPMRLLERKIIIDEMAAEGIRPDTPRQKSGAMPKYQARPKDDSQEGAGKGFKMPSLQIPDAREVLASEQLTSLAMAREFQDEIKVDTAKWQQQLSELPDKEKLAQYRERLNKLKSNTGLAGILGGASEVVSLRKEIQADLDRLKTAQKDFNQVSASYQKRLSELKEAPGKDIQQLLDKYSISATGLANLSPLLFGAKAGGMVEQALYWYARAQPLLERAREKKGANEIVKPVRGKGVFVRFREDAPLPDLLVRKINASVEIAAGTFSGTINNLTPDQDVLGLPLTFAFAGNSLQGLKSISFDGVLNHVDPGQSRDKFNLAVSGYSLAKAGLNAGAELPVTITGGLLDLAAEAVLQEQAINADVRAGLKSANITTAADKQGDKASQAIADALRGINGFNTKIKVTGMVDDYKLQLSSDLDKVFQQAVANTLKSQTAKFKQELEAGVMARVKDPLAAASTSFSGLGAISSKLADRLQMGSKLM